VGGVSFQSKAEFYHRHIGAFHVKSSYNTRDPLMTMITEESANVLIESLFKWYKTGKKVPPYEFHNAKEIHGKLLPATTTVFTNGVQEYMCSLRTVDG